MRGGIRAIIKLKDSEPNTPPAGQTMISWCSLLPAILDANGVFFLDP